MRSMVNRVLWEVWEPIGVNRIPNARGEYGPSTRLMKNK